MTPLTCILLDDEAGNLQLLKNMLAMHCPQLTILAAETNAEKGIQQISALQPQIVFLDIEMPRMNGFETLRKLEPVNFEVIFVTAFGKYAVQAFEHHAAGYVTKPVQAEKLQAAVNAAAVKD
ncbi:MAG: response regulator [Chitinophagaceae bacterium]|nr:response regulator [Chitinophagaceae bacterium]